MSRCTCADSRGASLQPLLSLNTLPSSIDAGLHWKQSDELFLTLTGSKVSNEPLSVQCGISWDVMKRLTLRTGYMSSPSAFAFGIGFKTALLEADAGFLLNGVTGVTSSVSITWLIR